MCKFKDALCENDYFESLLCIDGGNNDYDKNDDACTTIQLVMDG
jgi:hypothetical protein